MCLYIGKNYKKRWNNCRTRYKVVRQDRFPINFYLKNYQKYTTGRKVISDRISGELTKTEINERSILHGIHVYTQLSDAKNALHYTCTDDPLVVIKLDVSLKDFVASNNGTNQSFFAFKEEVYTKVKVIGKVK